MEMICINCPMGCTMTVEKKGESISVEGNKCVKGKQYAIEECTKPTRVLTSSVYIENGVLPVVSVKTACAIDKDKLFDALKVLKHTTCKAPVQMGDIMVENILGLGVNVIATKSIEKKN